jgi:hypothetical protein
MVGWLVVVKGVKGVIQLKRIVAPLKNPMQTVPFTGLPVGPTASKLVA